MGVLFIAFIFLQGCTTFNPATGRNEFIFISTDYEIELGKNMQEEVLKQYKLSNDAENVARVQRIGERVARVSDRQDYKYHFYLLDSKEINAFTMPGGNVYFFSGLMEKLSTDDEIAAVLSHEVGHCAARHVIKKFQAGMGYNLIAALVLSRLESESTQQLAQEAGNAGMGLVMNAYGRQDEYQADSLGVKYMYLAGYNLDGMINTLNVLKKEGETSNTPAILRTHPYVEDRIKAVQKEIDGAPQKYGPK